MNDNYLDTLRSVAQHVLDYGPEGLRPADRDRLARVASGEDQNGYFFVDFCRPSPNGSSDREAEASLRVTVYDSWTSRHQTDEDGNDWRITKVRASVNWASYGSEEPEKALRRLALMTDVALFAKRVQDAFPQDVCQLVRTREDKERAKAELERKRAKDEVSTAIRLHAKSMRIGQERIVSGKFVPGTYDYENGDRKYRAIVTGEAGFYFVRIV